MDPSLAFDPNAPVISGSDALKKVERNYCYKLVCTSSLNGVRDQSTDSGNGNWYGLVDR